jgi:hypothetical protein
MIDADSKDLYRRTAAPVATPSKNISKDSGFPED